MNENLTLIPLLQHYSEYSGDDIDVTAGIGDDRGYNWGAGLGLRFVY